MTYPAVGIVLTLGVLIGSAIYYFVNNRNIDYGYGSYNAEPYYTPHRTPTSSGDKRKAKSRKNQPNTECTICLSALEWNENKKTLSCGHVYHLSCITDWFRVSRTCPICRKA